MSGDSLRVMMRARLLDLHLGLEGRQLLERFPAVVEDVAGDRLEAAARIDAGDRVRDGGLRPTRTPLCSIIALAIVELPCPKAAMSAARSVPSWLFPKDCLVGLANRCSHETIPISCDENKARTFCCTAAFRGDVVDRALPCRTAQLAQRPAIR